MRNNYITGPRRGPHMDDCPGMGELAPENLSCGIIADNAIYSTLPSPVGIVRTVGIDVTAGGATLTAGEPVLVVHEPVKIGSDVYLISGAELAALRADRERLEELIGFLSHYYLFAVYVKLRCPGVTTDAMTATKEEWREAIDAARGAA